MEMPISKQLIVKTNQSLCQDWTTKCLTTHSKFDKDEYLIPADNTSQLQLATVKMQETSLKSFVLRNQWLVINLYA